MQETQTPESTVYEAPFEYDAEAPETTENAWTGDRPIYLTLAASGLSFVAAVPVMLAILGPLEVWKLLYACLLIGLLVGTSGLLVAGLAVSAKRALQARRTGEAGPSTKPTRGLRGKLAFG
ncbi:MAG: hypothetical protein AAF911_14885 [Planctomycetota bacterium]